MRCKGLCINVYIVVSVIRVCWWVVRQVYLTFAYYTETHTAHASLLSISHTVFFLWERKLLQRIWWSFISFPH